MKNPARLAGATMLGLVFGGLMLTACSSSPAKSTSGTTTTSGSKSSTTVQSTTTTSGAPQSLAVTPTLEEQLTAAYVAHSGLPADQVQGTVSGSVKYAFLPFTNTYWATADFEPTANSSTNTQVAMQDDGCCGIFSMTAGGSWIFVTGRYGPLCNVPVPQSILELWNDEPTAADCANTTPTTGAAAQNLPVTTAIKSDLVAAYVAHSHLPANQVAGTAPNSVYYGFIPSTSTYWAIATFMPTANSSTQTQVAMQDDGCCGIFTMSSGGSWIFVSGYLGSPCTGQIPAALMALWNLTSPGDCAPTTTTS